MSEHSPTTNTEPPALPVPHHPDATARRRRRRIAIIIVGALAAVVFAGGVVGVQSLTSQADATDCAPPTEMNRAFDQLLLESGAPFNADKLAPPEKAPFEPSTINELSPTELRPVLSGSCVYRLVPGSPGFKDEIGYFVVSQGDVDAKDVDRTLRDAGWTSGESDSEGSRTWENSRCGGRASEYTATAQGRSQLVGGFVEVFATRLADALPGTTFALMVVGGC